MNIKDILRERGIEYIESGSNVKHGNINIRCPFCGEADPSHHLGINLKGGSWGCWRDNRHRGRSLHILLMKLFGCSADAATNLLQDREQLKTKVRNLLPVTEVKEEESPEPFIPLKELKFIDHSPLYQRFRTYLLERHYDSAHLGKMITTYRLQGALTGTMKNRLVFPVTAINGVDVGYVGRAVDGGNLRYLSYPGTTIKRTILWLDKLAAYNDQLWIVEGPFDALRLDWYFRCSGIFQRATCLFGTAYTSEQLTAITQIAIYHNKINLLFDNDALSKAMRLRQELSCLITQRVQVCSLPDGVKDPAELQDRQIASLLR